MTCEAAVVPALLGGASLEMLKIATRPLLPHGSFRFTDVRFLKLRLLSCVPAGHPSFVFSVHPCWWRDYEVSAFFVYVFEFLPRSRLSYFV